MTFIFLGLLSFFLLDLEPDLRGRVDDCVGVGVVGNGEVVGVSVVVVVVVIVVVFSSAFSSSSSSSSDHHQPPSFCGFSSS